MESKYVINLYFCIRYSNIIELTDEEMQKSEKHKNFKPFLATLEDKYGFHLINTQWMTTKTLSIYRYKDRKEVDYAKLV